MRARRIIFFLLIGAFVGAIAIILQMLQTSAAAQSRLKELEARKARLQRELAQVRKTMAASQKASRPSDLVSATSHTSAAPEVRPSRPPGLMDIARENPQLLNLWIADQRSRLQQRYGVLFQQLHLAPAERERFKDILAARVARDTDISAALTEKGLEWNDPAAQALRAESDRQLRTDLVALLGEPAAEAFERFNESARLRGFVDGFAVQIAAIEPLTAAQAEQLAQALVAASGPAMKDKDRDIDPATVDWTNVDRVAQTVLTPSQFAAWKLGVAHNPYGGSRLDQELTRIYEAAKAKDSGKSVDSGESN